MLICHQWMGLSDNERRRAEDSARLGCVAFALDIYGKGVRPKDPQEAGKMAGGFKADRALLRARVQAGLDVLRKDPRCNPDKLAAMGYCFGGSASLELARSGAKLQGTVSFHGDLSSPTPEDARNIKGKVLVLHGADDPFVPAAQVAAFEDEMRAAAVADWQVISYGNTLHGFTNPAADGSMMRTAMYNEQADRRSWASMHSLFDEVLT